MSVLALLLIVLLFLCRRLPHFSLLCFLFTIQQLQKLQYSKPICKCLTLVRALRQSCCFSVIDRNVFWIDRKKLSHFGQNVWKYRLKILQWRVSIQLWDKWPKCLSEKEQCPSVAFTGCLLFKNQRSRRKRNTWTSHQLLSL